MIIAPGTAGGVNIIQNTAQAFAEKGILLAPYINNSFVLDKKYWIHLTQHFIRPEFQRLLRQKMKDRSLMASDWKEAKYAYVAISRFPSQVKFWCRCIGPVKKQKAFCTYSDSGLHKTAESA